MKKPTQYTIYHLHSYLSNGTTNLDSITNPDLYVKAAKECGMHAMAFSEHGNLLHWLHKKEAIEAAGMKYIHAIEAYVTSTLEEKIRDNYHCVLIAKNHDGVRELNKLISESFNRSDNHFHYVPRISFDELFATSDNIIITTACIGGVLNKADADIRECMIGFLARNRHRVYLEIQHHNCEEQITYNRMLHQMSVSMGIPLIAGTDTHALNDLHMEGRAVLQKAKDSYYPGEDLWDMTFKTCEQLIESYRIQDSLPMDVVYEAIENTNRMAEMIQPFPIDRTAKYPKLYDDSEAVFKQKINEGVKWRGINKLPNYREYLARIREEFETYKHNNAIDFMLLEEDYKSAMRAKGIKYGYSRGSVSGSVIAYLLGITEMDSVKYNLNFSRFMNRERVSLADVDSDWLADDRPVVKEYLFSKPGLYCCDIVTLNTIALRGAVNDVCRGLYKQSDVRSLLSPKWQKIYDAWEESCACINGQGTEVEMPDDLKAAIDKVSFDYMSLANEIIGLAEIDMNAARKKYPKEFRYIDLVIGCVVSVGNHPAGVVVSPTPVDEWFGTFSTAGDEYPVSMLNMKEIDSLNFVKLDILGLDNIGLIYKTCDLAGIPFLTPDNTPPDDMDVWNSIREDTTMIFQWESQSATAYLRQLFSDETIGKIRSQNPDFTYMDLLSIGNGAIRPAGESYRDKLAQGVYQNHGHAALNEFMKPTLGYCVYQEQIIEFLHKFCGFTMGEADIVRRHFAKKTGTETDIPIIKDGGYLTQDKKHYIKGFIQTMHDDYSVDRQSAEGIIGPFLQVIIDASDYLFSKNHADPYSWIGYICGYLRYHYPLEFITVALNIFADKEDKSLAIIAYAKKQGIRISPIKFRHSVAQYNFDRDTNEIFKGIASIKYMNAQVADEMYALRDKHYANFVQLLYDLSECTTLNSRQLKILIELDFFVEFGDANLLMRQYELYDALSGRKQFKKDALEGYGISEDLVRSFAGKETEKMFTSVNVHALLLEAANGVKAPRRTLRQKMQAQLTHLGYLDISGQQYTRLLMITDVNTKYAPRLTTYSLRNGTNMEFRVDRRTFNCNKLAVGDIIRVISDKPKEKMRRLENGDFEPIPGVFERWLTKYEKVENI